MNLKGSKTEKNLYRTFAGESRARNKYTLFAEIARLEGYHWIASIFEEIAHNELAHARRVYNDLLMDIGNTKENLLAAIAGETSEYNEIYKNFEKEAKEEGFEEIAKFYKDLQEAEEGHAEKYTELYNKLCNNEIFKDDSSNPWICMNCGYIYEGNEAPTICPLCKYPKSYFRPECKTENE